MAKKTQEELEKAIKKYEMGRKPLTLRQTKLGLLNAGLLSQVESAIASLPEPDKSQAEIEWQYASQVKRNDPWLLNIAGQLGLAEEQIDDLFYNAYQL